MNSFTPMRDISIFFFFVISAFRGIIKEFGWDLLFLTQLLNKHFINNCIVIYCLADMEVFLNDSFGFSSIGIFW